ncbi:hypothetical protein ACJVDH_03765 [Pedobacter sp. AW1-32]|uniref:hypothetical protein n=1 Tax=Pedobacter sp. AW1-32 TaxID=3383026 RepID=UPI003FEE15B9
MKTELIQEFQLLQMSRANKIAEDLADRVISSVDALNEKVSTSITKRGKMLMMLENRLNLSSLKRFQKRFFKS